MIKKIFIICTLVVALSLSGCGNKQIWDTNYR